MAAVTVLGSGSWGTALAVHLARINHEVTLWLAMLTSPRSRFAPASNNVHLPEVAFPSNLRVEGSLRIQGIFPATAASGSASAGVSGSQTSPPA